MKDSDSFPDDVWHAEFKSGIEDVILLHHCVSEFLRLWPGSPARPAEEQERLKALKSALYGAILDHTLQSY